MRLLPCSCRRPLLAADHCSHGCSFSLALATTHTSVMHKHPHTAAAPSLPNPSAPYSHPDTHARTQPHIHAATVSLTLTLTLSLLIRPAHIETSTVEPEETLTHKHNRLFSRPLPTRDTHTVAHAAETSSRLPLGSRSVRHARASPDTHTRQHQLSHHIHTYTLTASRTYTHLGHVFPELTSMIDK